jgi:membrane protein
VSILGGRGRDVRIASSAATHSVRQTMAEVARAANRHRTTGHAAEMAFFAVLTLVPSTVAVGAALGLSESVIGVSAVAEAEESAMQAVTVLMGPVLADSVVAPFVHAQLTQPSGGVALGSLLLAWWLSSHLFAATAHALDRVYGVTDRRAGLVRRLIALAFALGSVVVVALTAELMVAGPLGQSHVGPLRNNETYALLWSIVRWPLLVMVLVTFLILLYRFSPNVRHNWRQCAPGALVGAVLWILAAAVFRLATEAGIRFASGVTTADPRVTLIGESVSAVVATALWAYLASIAILYGAELNALVDDRRARVAGDRRHEAINDGAA